MKKELTIHESNEKITLKNGRKTYAEITLNNNPEYKWVIWFSRGGALSGYETKELAISRAQEMFDSVNKITIAII